MQILSIAFVLVLVQSNPLNERRLDRDVPGNVNNNPMFDEYQTDGQTGNGSKEGMQF